MKSLHPSQPLTVKYLHPLEPLTVKSLHPSQPLTVKYLHPLEPLTVKSLHPSQPLTVKSLHRPAPSSWQPSCCRNPSLSQPFAVIIPHRCISFIIAAPSFRFTTLVSHFLLLKSPFPPAERSNHRRNSVWLHQTSPRRQHARFGGPHNVVAFGNAKPEFIVEKAKKALECPCIAGFQFSEAFLCFLKSTAEAKEQAQIELELRLFEALGIYPLAKLKGAIQSSKCDKTR